MHSTIPLPFLPVRPVRRRGRAFGFLAILLFATSLAVSCGPSDPVASVRARLEAGDYRGSLEPLRELLTERPDDAEVEYLYGLALVRTGQSSLAEWTLREAMKDPEWRLPAGVLLTETALETNNLPVAIETASELLEDHPDNVDLLMMRANGYAHYQQDPEKALADVERIFELDPDHVDAMEPKILALLALERFDEAEEALDELGERIERAELGPETQAWYCGTLAVFAQDGGRDELAAERFDDCVERYPTSADVVPNAVSFFDERGEFDRSLEILRRAHEEEPGSREYRVILAQRLREMGKPEEAETILVEAAEQEHPQLAPSAWIDVAKHHQSLRDYEASAKATERALAAGKQAGIPLAQLQFERADSLILAGRYEEALAVADEMTLPAHQHLIRGRVAQERGRHEEALEHFEEGLRLWPNNAIARYYSARAAEATGQFDEALESYRYAIRIDPGNTDARSRAARLLADQGELSEALGLLQVMTRGTPPSFRDQVYAIELLARGGAQARMLQWLATVQGDAPLLLGEAVAGAARGTQARQGAEAAVELLRRFQSDGLSYAGPEMSDALRELVVLSHEAGSLEEARKDVRAALEQYPESATLHEIQGRGAELAGEPEAAESAYRTALEHDPDNARALAGLGRLRLENDPEAALGHFEEALASEPTSTEALRGAAEALVALGRREEATEQLDALLVEHPTDAKAALRQVRMDLTAGLATERTVERAQRAVRFGGGLDALDLLSQVLRERGEVQRAERVAAQAGRLREALEARAQEDAGAENGKDSS